MRDLIVLLNLIINLTMFYSFFLKNNGVSIACRGGAHSGLKI